MATLSTTIIQPDLKWEDKEFNLKKIEGAIQSIQTKTELVVLPEMFSTGFSMNAEALAEPMSGDSVQWMRRVAKEYNIILTGSLIISEEGRFYNRLIWMLPNGQIGYYDKRHCFAYGGEHEHYTPGDKRLIASAKGWKINLQVCYDLRFPVWARQQPSEDGTPEYDLLIYVANWPQRRSLAWKTLLRARAIENQCFVIGVNRVGNDGHQIYHSGDSMIIDPLGELLAEAPEKEAVITVTLDQQRLQEVRNSFPFWKDGDHFELINNLPST